MQTTVFHPAPSRHLTDPHGRHIDYVRISLTDRCNLRCTYCMPENMRFAPRPDLLDAAEIASLVEAFVDRGVTRIRLTGGEPLVRHDSPAIITALGRMLGDGLEELTVTTNGTLLERHAPMLADAGVERVNVSLDTLRADRFRTITRHGNIDRVLDGLAAARKHGLSVRVNIVAQRGMNDDEIIDIVEYCDAHGFDLAVIEAMPLGSVAPGVSDSFIPLGEFLRPLGAQGMDLVPLAFKSSGPARYFTIPGKTIKIGLISALSNNFCAGCNRIRVTATGRIYQCLGRDDHVDLREALRSSDRGLLDDAIDRALAAKPLAHDFVTAQQSRQPAVARTMNQTGG